MVEKLDDSNFHYLCLGGRASNRVYRTDSLWNIRFCARLGGLWNRGARALRRADAVLDITGGDSFTDMYGMRVFKYACFRKRMALENRKPLFLLPQTYGPFTTPETRREARDICTRAAGVWVRDPRSYEYLQELLESDFDPDRHRLGVDVAFLLPTLQPTLDAEIERFIEPGPHPLIGFNVSGLVWASHERNAERFSFQADYRESVLGFLKKVLKETNHRILLIPHVVTPPDHYESDLKACRAVEKQLKDLAPPERLAVAPAYPDPRMAKGLISKMDWFCGTRMHATIAGLSTGTPTAAIAYSMKTQGVFDACGQGESVADPRSSSTEEMIEGLWRSLSQRESNRKTLSEHLPAVKGTANRQMDEIVGRILDHRSGAQIPQPHP